MDINQLDAALGLDPDEDPLAQSFGAEQAVEPNSHDLHPLQAKPEAPPVMAAVPAAQGLQYQSIVSVLKVIPPEIRVEVLEVANALNVKPDDDLLYSILAGLGYHKHLVAGVPDKIQGAGEATIQHFIEVAEGISNELSKQGMNCSSSILESGRAAKSEITDAAKILSDQVLIAARKGVSQAATEIDLSKILTHIQSFSESQVQSQAKGKIRDWFGKGVLLASIVSISVLICGFALAWVIKPAPPDYQMLQRLFGQLSCKATKTQYICSDKQGGRVVFEY